MKDQDKEHDNISKYHVTGFLLTVTAARSYIFLDLDDVSKYVEGKTAVFTTTVVSVVCLFASSTS